MDAGKLLDQNILGYDNDGLPSKLAIHLIVLQEKMDTHNDKLSKLRDFIDKVVNNDNVDWSIDYLTKELEQLDGQYELSYKNFQNLLKT